MNSMRTLPKGGGAATADRVLPTTGTGLASGGGMRRCGVSGERTANSVFHRPGAIPAHEAQRAVGLAQKLAAFYSRTGAAEKGGRSGEATALATKATGSGGGEAEKPAAIASRMDGSRQRDAIL